MHSRLSRLAAVAAAAGLVVTGAPAAASVATTTAGRPAAAPSMAGAPAPRQVLFPAGERALVTGQGGRTRLVPLPNAGKAAAGMSMTLSTAGRTYDLPLDALPYLGRGLDPALFDPAALLARESSGRIPVRVRYHGAAVPRLPGVTVTAPSGGAAGTARTARGYLTAASAARFGAALARQYAADHARASYGKDGMFAGGVSVSLAGTAPAQASKPEAAMHTLTITGTSPSGHPDTGDVVLVFNVDNGYLNAVIGTTQVFYHGIVKVSVPAGHYFAIAGYITLAPGGNPVDVTAARMDVLPQFAVTKNTTVHTSANAATSRITMATPRPATAESSDFSVLRTAASGPPSQALISGPGRPIWVSPTSHKPSTGRLSSYAAQQLASPAGPGTPYQYELSYAHAGIIPAQTYHVATASLATVTDAFYQDVPASGQWNTSGMAVDLPRYPPTAGVINSYPHPLRLPGRQVRYIGGNVPATNWSDYYLATDAAGNVTGVQFAGLYTARPGEHLTDDWNQYPLHPGPTVNLDPRDSYSESLPSASREGDTLTVSVTPFDDNQPDHYGDGTGGISGATTTGSYQIDQGGTQVASGSVPIGPSGSSAFTTQATLRPDPSTIRFELDASQTGPSFPMSTVSSTVWTWRSSHESGDTLPRGWYCDDAALSSICRIEPMMTLLYHVHGMALNGTTAPGRQVLGITAGHIQAARQAAITGATVQVSFDDGATWQDATVTRLGPGSYRAVYNAPAGAYVTLRTTATDAVGGSVAETITRGYQIAS